MFCIHCGANNPDNYNFCYKCGKQRSEAAASSPPNTEDPFSAAIQDATLEILDEDRTALEVQITKALKSPDRTLEEVVEELRNAAEITVDEAMAKRAKTVLKVLTANRGNHVANLIRSGTLAPYETAFAAHDFFHFSRWSRTLPDGKKGSNVGVVKQDYASYIRMGIDGLLPHCTAIGHENASRLLSQRGLKIWLEYELVKDMLLSLSLDRRRVVSDDTTTLNSRLGPELTNKIMNYLTNLLSVVRWD